MYGLTTDKWPAQSPGLNLTTHFCTPGFQTSVSDLTNALVANPHNQETMLK